MTDTRIAKATPAAPATARTATDKLLETANKMVAQIYREPGITNPTPAFMHALYHLEIAVKEAYGA